MYLQEWMYPALRYTKKKLSNMEKLSNCCGALIINPDICSDCKDHCDPEPDLDEELDQNYDEENNDQESDTE